MIFLAPSSAFYIPDDQLSVCMLLTVFLKLPDDSEITQIITSDSSESEGKQIKVPLNVLKAQNLQL